MPERDAALSCCRLGLPGAPQRGRHRGGAGAYVESGVQHNGLGRPTGREEAGGQQFACSLAHLIGRLRDRRKRRANKGSSRDLVEAHHADLPGHLDVVLDKALQRADGHQVVGHEHRVQVGVGQQRSHRLEAAPFAEVSAPDE